MKPQNLEEVPIKDKFMITIYEANKYFGIGLDKLREMVKEPSCNFAVQVGEKKQMIIRTKLEEYLIENRLI